MLSRTAELAKASRLAVSLIPDFLFASMKRRSKYIFSFHAAGEFPGFVHFRTANLPDYMIIDEGGYSGRSGMPDRSLSSLDLPPLDEAEAICDQLYHDVVLGNVSNDAQPATTAAAVPLPKRDVFVRRQGPLNDAPGLVRFGPKAVLQLVIERFRAADIAVRVKMHPKVTSPNPIIWLIGQADFGSVIMREDSIHTLAAGPEAIMKTNSCVGSEVMMQKNPIYGFGAGAYDSIVQHIATRARFRGFTTPMLPAMAPS